MDNSGIEVLMQRGQWDEAIAACRAALQVTPTNARLNGYLGMCLFRKGDFAAAIDPFRRATMLDPKFWEAGAKLAQCYDRLHRYEEAYSVAKEWLRLAPSDRILQGLVYTLEDQVKGNRKDGWERTGHLHHEVTFTGN
jgi:Flp pilus assembly protein TadD